MTSIMHLHQQLSVLETENRQLFAQRESLESQVMEMARQPEIPADWWAKVTFIMEGGEDEASGFIIASEDDPVA